MKCSIPHKTRALTLIEVLIVVAGLLFLASLILPRSTVRRHYRSPRINCVNNLKQVGLRFRDWAVDHGDKYPMQVSMTNGGTMELIESAPAFRHFQVMSNELSTPKMLYCPADDERQYATNFTRDFHNDRISYFVGLDGMESDPQMLLSGDRNITNGLPVKGGLLTLPPGQSVGWTGKIHVKQGNILFADASVQQLGTSGLRTALEKTGMETNRLAVP